jgi:hypothetical protein
MRTAGFTGTAVGVAVGAAVGLGREVATVTEGVAGCAVGLDVLAAPSGAHAANVAASANERKRLTTT